MNDPKNARLAKVFIEHSLKVKAKDNVVISTSDTYPEDLIRECYKQALKKDANVYLDIMGFNFLLDRTSTGDFARTFYENANERQIRNPSKIYGEIADWGDKFIRITSFGNYQHLASIDSAKMQMKMKAARKWFDTVIDKDWILTYYPDESFVERLL